MNDDPHLTVDDDPDPSRTYWTVVWDYVGGDCGDLPGEFATEAEAKACGEDWVLEARESQDLPQEGEESPAFHVVRHEVQLDGGQLVYDEDGKLMYGINTDGERS